MSKELPPALDRIARAQHGVFSRKQALRAGLTKQAIKSRVRRGTWRRLYAGVYMTSTAPPDRLASLWAAVLYAGPGAVLSYETAAELHGLLDEPSVPIHVSIPAERRAIAAPGLRIHRTSRVLDAPDAHRDPPHTTIEETLLDLATTAVDLDAVCGWITRAFARELTSEPRLISALSGRLRMRWRTELADVVKAGATGDHSVLEYRYTRDVERAHGLPSAIRQASFQDPSGRRGRRDRVYQGYRVVIELDGKLAHRSEDGWRDKARDRAAIAAGMQPLRYGWADVYGNPCGTAAEVAKILQQNGWKGTPRQCSPECPV
ncbi:MAG TPA: type IV toxin-antitoxin system AbiEi family antitoxin domain-containing protein [Streptosporangiaceae bacterium]